MFHRTLRSLLLSAAFIAIAAPEAFAQCAVLNADRTTANVNTAITLTWTAPTAACTTPTQPNFVGYRVYAKPPGGSFAKVGDNATNDQDFQFTVTQTGTYQFYVAAVYTNQVCGDCMITEGNSNVVTVTSQAAPVCTYMLQPPSVEIGSGGATGNFIVMTAAQCSWVAVSTQPFVTITSGAGGTGSGTVSYTVQSNSGMAREGAIIVADVAGFIIRQGAAPARAAKRRAVRH